MKNLTHQVKTLITSQVYDKIWDPFFLIGEIHVWNFLHNNLRVPLVNNRIELSIQNAIFERIRKD